MHWPSSFSASSSKTAAGTAKLGPLVAETPPSGAFLPHHHLCARRTARIRAGRAQMAGRYQGPQAGRKLSTRAPYVPLTSNRQGNRQSLVALLVPDVLALDVLRGLDYLRNAGVQPDSRVRDAIKIVIERRHQNGRWPLNLLHPEPIPIAMETAVGRASRWNTLRALRVLCWYDDAKS